MPPTAPPTTETRAWIRKEVRFAVVMYGGVSLAIYINGVAQELWRMVRSTALNERGDATLLDDDELTGTERVYRKLGRLLGPDGLGDAEEGPVQTRFVVDVLSGTSAGGINAVFLAKALANNQPLSVLQGLWVKEGDIGLLINDHLSKRKHRGARSEIEGLSYQKTPSSLLNSARMYRKLLDAFDEMESAVRSTEGTPSPLVDELDLFVTATDYHGQILPLKLSDGVVQEMRHRNVFHFNYNHTRDARPHNDFLASNNGMLAFVSRCTSSFPFAFEPMRFASMADALIAARGENRTWHPGTLEGALDEWGRFFSGSGMTQNLSLKHLANRPFVDGGYLDNKPFSYAISALESRSGGAIVDRKLVYIEPNPDTLKGIDAVNHEDVTIPNALANSMSAFTLARYETIREDLQEVLKRNRLIERVRHVIRDNQRDVGHDTRARPQDGEGFSYYEADLTEMIPRWGVAYGGYHRLKVAALTDFMARLVTQLADFETDSDEYLAVRRLVLLWREANYSTYHEAGKKTENAFLVEYDLLYRIRRIRFVIDRIDERISRCTYEEFVTLDTLRGDLKYVHVQLQRLQAAVRRDTELRAAIAATGMNSNTLREMLRDEGYETADLGPLMQQLDAVAKRLAALLKDASPDTMGTFRAAKACERILRMSPAGHGGLEAAAPLPKPGEPEMDEAIIAEVRRFYEDFERYDLITYPVLQAANVGNEADHVDVFRISPNDGTAMRRDGADKLEGTYLMNFGAFLDGAWRKNDILWGRLDGAERIIAALLPDDEHEAVRSRLIREAHEAIIEEELRPYGLLTGVDGDGHKPLFDSPEIAYQELQKPEKRRPREQTSEENARTLTRSTRVVGKMLDGISVGKYASWVSRTIAKIGTLIWGLVEVSVPDSMWRLIFRHNIKLLYFFGALLIVAGILEPILFRLGLAAVLAALVVDVASWVLKSLFAGRRIVAKLVIYALAVLVAVLAGIGGYEVFLWMERWLEGLVQ